MSSLSTPLCYSAAGLLLLALTACSPAQQDTTTASAAALPQTAPADVAAIAEENLVILHARLYVKDQTSTPAIGSANQLQAAFHLQTPVRVEGTGLDARFSDIFEREQVQGQLVASGDTEFKTEPALTEHYKMQAVWPEPVAVKQGRFRVWAPEPSRIGTGYSVKVELEVPVSGDKKAQISSEGTLLDTDITHARPLACGTEEGQEICKLSYTVDAVPTTAQDEAGQLLLDSAKTLYASQGKINSDGGLIMYGSLVPVYGAVSNLEDGHLVIRSSQQYSLNFKDANMAQQLELVVWTSAPGDNWQPDNLPPLAF
ncbi:MAG: hypothetical protein U5L02_05190 [Rheinheimera sp.]|nr:hypothetical protein [Rheinheimera sp.]